MEINPRHTPDPDRRWLICALLFAATAINYLDRQILSLLKPILDGDLGWTNEQYGYVTAAFQGAYGVGLLAFGRFIDRCGTRLGYAVAISLWSAAALSHSLATTIAGFMLARVALGLGEGGNFPAAIKTVAQWFPQPERAFATGLFNAGSSVGAVLAPALIPWVALRWGWQTAFVAAGLTGFGWLGMWLWFYPAGNAPVGESLLAPAPPKKPRWASLALLRHRQTWSFIIAKMILDPVVWFFLIWLPDFFKQTRGLDLQTSWRHLVAIYALTTLVGVAGAWLSGACIRRGWSVTRARKSVMLLSALAMLPILAVARAGDWAAVILIGLGCAAISAYAANLFSSVSDMFPPASVATVVGLGGLAGCISGMIFPVFCGHLLDAFKATGAIARGYDLLFSLCAFGGLLAFCAGHILAPRFEPVDGAAGPG